MASVFDLEPCGSSAKMVTSIIQTRIFTTTGPLPLDCDNVTSSDDASCVVWANALQNLSVIPCSSAPSDPPPTDPLYDTVDSYGFSLPPGLTLFSPPNDEVYPELLPDTQQIFALYKPAGFDRLLIQFWFYDFPYDFVLSQSAWPPTVSSTLMEGTASQDISYFSDLTVPTNNSAWYIVAMSNPSLVNTASADCYIGYDVR